MTHVMCHMSRDTCHVTHVTCQVSRVTCHVSGVRFIYIYIYIFFLQSDGASRLRVCYQEGLPVYVVNKNLKKTYFYNKELKKWMMHL